MPVRPSQVLARRRAGQAAHGVAVRLTDPTVAEFAAQLGFDAL
jgi:2-keto-3-deoxy-L-rhamnonate aldolase RhmA